MKRYFSNKCKFKKTSNNNTVNNFKCKFNINNEKCKMLECKAGKLYEKALNYLQKVNNYNKNAQDAQCKISRLKQELKEALIDYQTNIEKCEEANLIYENLMLESCKLSKEAQECYNNILNNNKNELLNCNKFNNCNCNDSNYWNHFDECQFKFNCSWDLSKK